MDPRDELAHELENLREWILYFWGVYSRYKEDDARYRQNVYAQNDHADVINQIRNLDAMLEHAHDQYLNSTEYERRRFKEVKELLKNSGTGGHGVYMWRDKDNKNVAPFVRYKLSSDGSKVYLPNHSRHETVAEYIEKADRKGFDKEEPSFAYYEFPDYTHLSRVTNLGRSSSAKENNSLSRPFGWNPAHVTRIRQKFPKSDVMINEVLFQKRKRGG